jgi:hypothetical protein
MRPAFFSLAEAAFSRRHLVNPAAAATSLQDQQWALAESALDRVFAVPSDGNRVLEAASLFIAQGGRWRPSNQLARHTDDTALGRA